MAYINGMSRLTIVAVYLLCPWHQLAVESSIDLLPASVNLSVTVVSSAPSHSNGPVFLYATPELWSYLRKGLNYLESPKPLSDPESVAPSYMHPDSKGFGAYGFSPIAYSDVQRLYPFFKKYSWQDITDSASLYDLANQAFADWLLKNLQHEIQPDAAPAQIFHILHQAWNLGLAGYKRGRCVVSSRLKREEEFLSL